MCKKEIMYFTSAKALHCLTMLNGPLLSLISLRRRHEQKARETEQITSSRRTDTIPIKASEGF